MSVLSEGTIAILGELRDHIEKLEVENQQLRKAINNKKVLSESDVNRIRSWYSKGLFTQAELAEKFEVNPATISRTVRGIYHSGS